MVCRPAPRKSKSACFRLLLYPFQARTCHSCDTGNKPCTLNPQATNPRTDICKRQPSSKHTKSCSTAGRQVHQGCRQVHRGSAGQPKIALAHRYHQQLQRQQPLFMPVSRVFHIYIHAGIPTTPNQLHKRQHVPAVASGTTPASCRQQSQPTIVVPGHVGGLETELSIHRGCAHAKACPALR